MGSSPTAPTKEIPANGAVFYQIEESPPRSGVSGYVSSLLGCGGLTASVAFLGTRPYIAKSHVWMVHRPLIGVKLLSSPNETSKEHTSLTEGAREVAG